MKLKSNDFPVRATINRSLYNRIFQTCRASCLPYGFSLWPHFSTVCWILFRKIISVLSYWNTALNGLLDIWPSYKIVVGSLIVIFFIVKAIFYDNFHINLFVILKYRENIQIYMFIDDWSEKNRIITYPFGKTNSKFSLKIFSKNLFLFSIFIVNFIVQRSISSTQSNNWRCSLCKLIKIYICIQKSTLKRPISTKNQY